MKKHRLRGQEFRYGKVSCWHHEHIVLERVAELVSTVITQRQKLSDSDRIHFDTLIRSKKPLERSELNSNNEADYLYIQLIHHHDSYLNMDSREQAELKQLLADQGIKLKLPTKKPTPGEDAYYRIRELYLSLDPDSKEELLIALIEDAEIGILERSSLVSAINYKSNELAVSQYKHSRRGYHGDPDNKDRDAEILELKQRNFSAGQIAMQMRTKGYEISPDAVRSVIRRNMRKPQKG